MVSDQDRIRTKLQSKVFDRIGKTVTLKAINTPTYNDRGELEQETTDDSSITIVPYSILFATQSYQAFGNLEAGELDAAIPYTVTVNIDDIIEIESVEYRIKNLEKNWLPENVVTIVRLAKVQS